VQLTPHFLYHTISLLVFSVFEQFPCVDSPCLYSLFTSTLRVGTPSLGTLPLREHGFYARTLCMLGFHAHLGVRTWCSLSAISVSASPRVLSVFAQFPCAASLYSRNLHTRTFHVGTASLHAPLHVGTVYLRTIILYTLSHCAPLPSS
jgi:hypothetical protein